MKRFLTKTGLFGLIFSTIVIGGLLITHVSYPQDMHFALHDKHKLLEETKGPRIILAGGSNLTFGINSPMMRDALEINVVNSSLHAGMGLRYILDDITPYLEEGDIVILSPEYSQFFGDTFWGNEPLVSSIIAVPKNIRLFSPHNWRRLFGTVPKRALQNYGAFSISTGRRILGIKKSSPYHRPAFNDLGDVVAHYGKAPVPFANVETIHGEFNEQAITRVKKLRNTLASKNGTLLLSYSNLNRGSFVHLVEKIRMVETRFKKEAFRVLGTPERYCFSDDLYYNTSTHMTERGAIERTRRLVDDIRKADVLPVVR